MCKDCALHRAEVEKLWDGKGINPALIRLYQSLNSYSKEEAIAQIKAEVRAQSKERLEMRLRKVALRKAT